MSATSASNPTLIRFTTLEEGIYNPSSSVAAGRNGGTRVKHCVQRIVHKKRERNGLIMSDRANDIQRTEIRQQICHSGYQPVGGSLRKCGEIFQIVGEGPYNKQGKSENGR